jgi:PAS domain S-box-containing protein
MTDQEMQAAMRVLSLLWSPANIIDARLSHLNCCQMVNLTLQYGVTDAAAHGFGWFGMFLGPVFRRYTDGYRFGKLACDLVEKYSFHAYRAKTYIVMEIIALWTQPIASAIEYLRAALRAGAETGDLIIACYSHNHVVTDILLRGDPLEEVWLESERSLDFDRKARFRDAAAIVESQQRFLLNMRGKTSTFSSFSDSRFEEVAFEAQLMSEATPTTICWYWIIKLQARFISGDYDMALAASRKAKELLLSSATNIQLLDYHYYTALTIAAIYNTASPGRQREWREELTVHLAQLREWAENGSATFLDKFELVSAEIARVEGRQFDAEGLYEQAIRSAREQAFVQNEGLANELAAQFYAGRGFETIANAYLRNARYCYLRWGADDKVRQLDQMHSHLREEPTRPRATSTTGTAVEHLDLATVIKVSQAVSGEIVLEKLVQTLMVIALEHAGAERGLLILPRDEEMRVEAEATTGHDTVEVCLRQAVVTSSEVPESILHYVMRTQESVLLDDALAPNQFSADEYIRQKHSRSVLCLPLVKQAKLTGVLYLENNLTSHVFTRSRIAVLNLLASQAAISLENARLYTDMQQTEVYLQAAQRLSHTGSFGWHPATGAIVWSEETYRIVGYDPGIKPTIDLIFQRIHPEDIAYVQQTLDRGVHGGTDLDFEHRFLMPDGSIKYVHIVAHALRDERDNLEYVGSAIDVTEQHQARAALEKAFTEIKKSEDQLRIIIDTIPTLAWCALRDGSAEFLNQRWHDYTGLSAQEAQGWGWTVAIHPEDSTKLVEKWRTILASGEPGESEARMRRFDGEYRWFLFRAVPLRDERGNIVRWYGTNTDIEDRKGAEEALRSNAQSFRLIVDSIPGLVCTMTAAGEVELVNRQILEYFGKTFEALKGWATSDGVHPHDLPRVMAAWMRSIETGQPYDIEHRIRRADGIYRWFHVRALPQRDTEGRIVRWHVLLTDIDDRKKAEEKLRRSEASLLDAQRLSRTGSWTHDFLSGTVTISPETVRMWGIQTENDAAVTDFFLARMHPEDRLRVEQAYREAQLKKADFESDFRIVLPDGTIKDIHSIGRPIVSEAGDIVEFIGAAIDITERKRAEQRLMVQHTVTQMLAEAATLEEVTPKILQTVGEFLSWELGVLWSIDREAGVLRCVELWHKESVEAPQFEAISRESTFMAGIGLPGRVWSSHEPAYIPDVVRDANFPRASIAAREGLHAAFGFPILLGGDVLGVMEFFSHEIRQPEPELLNMMATIGSQIGQFIEGKRAEEKLHKAQAELAHVTRVTTMGELTASIAHEVNQPLAAVVTNANACLRWLAGGPPNLDEARDAVGRIVRDGNRAADVIARIRALARKTDPEKARLDINETVQEIILLAQSEAGHKGVALRMELAADLPPVLGDRVQLQQVILNLVMNGIEATASVTDRRRELLIRSRQHGSDRVLVAVQDSGIGIERQNLEKIFDPFYTTKSQGMGMGLAISRSIIENHGGRLWAVPNEGAGAIFQFTLLKYQ